MTITDPRQFIDAARQFAHDAHDSIHQKRKYTGAPYHVHTDEVAGIVASVTHDPEMIAAAHLHDVVEDVNKEPYTLASIKTIFGERVAALVFALTDQFTKENFPELNRKQRKNAEAERLGQIERDAQTIKYADFISNTADISLNDPHFAKTYLREKAHILSLMTKGDPYLFAQAKINLEKR